MTRERTIGSVFAAAALIFAVQGILCALVWNQLSAAMTLDPGETADLVPFPGGLTTIHVLWFAGLVGTAAALVQVLRPWRPVLALLALGAAFLGSYGVWDTPARPGGDGALVPGLDQGFDAAALFCLFAVGCSAFGVLLARPIRGR